MCDDSASRPDLYKSAWRKARKPHRCDVCRETIARGHTYRYTFGVWDGSPDTFHHCVRCWMLVDLMVERSGEQVDLLLNCGVSWVNAFDELEPEAVAALAFAKPGELEPKSGAEIVEILKSPPTQLRQFEAFYCVSNDDYAETLYVPGMKVLPDETLALPPWSKGRCFHSMYKEHLPGYERASEATRGPLGRKKVAAADRAQGFAALDTLHGWTMISFWDPSADERPGAASHIMVKGEHGFDEALELASKHFPEVLARLREPLQPYIRQPPPPPPLPWWAQENA